MTDQEWPARPAPAWTEDQLQAALSALNASQQPDLQNLADIRSRLVAAAGAGPVVSGSPTAIAEPSTTTRMPWLLVLGAAAAVAAIVVSVVLIIRQPNSATRAVASSGVVVTTERPTLQDRETISATSTQSGPGVTQGSVPSSYSSDPGTAPLLRDSVLANRSYRLVATYSDTALPGNTFGRIRVVLRFSSSGATIETFEGQRSCGTLRYQDVQLLGAQGIELGEPVGKACSMGPEWLGFPSGYVLARVDGDRLDLGTGFAGWQFEQE